MSSTDEADAELQDQQLQIIKQHVNYEPSGESGWKLASEFPTADEILAPMLDLEDLPHNLVGMPWISKEKYLETQYSLLRREGMECLRHAVNFFRARPEDKDNEILCVYKKVRVVGFLMARVGPICRISFSTRNAGRRVMWQQSPRLTPGTLVAISTAADGFKKICKLATVAQRPYKDGLDQDPPLVDIIWARQSEAVVDPELELTMVEARSGYFEAVRHALIGLQMAARSESIFDKYLVDGDRSDPPAQFIQEKPVLDMSSLASDPKPTTDWKLLREHNILGGSPNLEGITSMDSSQIEAVTRIVSKELAIIQGPPGTGKTFTSVTGLRVILSSRKPGDPPVIVAAQTNHAVDQLLSLIQAHGARILRLGGRTEHEKIEECTMFRMRQRSKIPNPPSFRSCESTRQANVKTLRALASAAFSDGLLDPEKLREVGVLTKAQYASLVDDDMEQCEAHKAMGPFSIWLGDECIPAQVLRESECDWLQGDDNDDFRDEEHEYDGDLEHIAVDEEDRERIRGPFIPLAHTWTGKEPAHLLSWTLRAERELLKDDLFMIPKYMRGAVYRLLMAKYIEKMQPLFAACLEDNVKICKESKIGRWAKDIQIVAEHRVDIVGCTTTGLTKYRGFLAALQPHIMVIEEAAETRESNITSALFPSLQQLILVGDHLQLTPHCDVRWLGEEPFHLKVSLFQRLVELGLPHVVLNKQRRMVPSIRRILTPFYPILTDHDLVSDISKRPPVPGMGNHNTWLFTHRWEEEVDSNRSRYNEQEAQMIVHFFGYLVSNGVKPSQITILTFYNGQRKVILGKLKKTGSVTADSFNVFTVDSYQGEENDIVLLSLVRSPSPNNPWVIGFLENQNRAIVAISRARRGFYLFGNMDNVLGAHMDSRELWGKIWNGFAEIGRVRRRKGLPLTCQKHSKTVWVKEVEDWGDNAGGCNEQCQDARPCGHRCTLKCHIIPHENLPCSQPCSKVMECTHRCANMCSLECYCTCENYKSLKARKESVAKQAEEHLHLSFEELLAREAGITTPSIPGKKANGTPFPAIDAASKFRDYVENIEFYDDRDLREHLAARGVVGMSANGTGGEQGTSGNQSGEHAGRIPSTSGPVIIETWKPMTLINGVRVPAGPKVVVRRGECGPSMKPQAPAKSEQEAEAGGEGKGVGKEKEGGHPPDEEELLIQL